MRHVWVAYGLDMDGIQIVETEGVNISESHEKAVEHFNNSNLNCDGVMSYESYIKEWEKYKIPISKENE